MTYIYLFSHSTIVLYIVLFLLQCLYCFDIEHLNNLRADIKVYYIGA